MDAAPFPPYGHLGHAVGLSASVTHLGQAVLREPTNPQLGSHVLYTFRKAFFSSITEKNT